MAFSSYWKEIIVVLAGVFAIFGALSDVKDKRTGKFTIWGRVFFLLTFLSMLGGVYAQWLDNASEEKRNKDAQAGMLSLLQRTEKSVYDLSRLLQPIDKPSVTLFLIPDCNNKRFKDFCDSVKARGRQQAAMWHLPPSEHDSFTVTDVDWSSWPDSVLSTDVVMYFFKNADAAQKFISDGCLICDSGGDMYLRVPVSSQKINRQEKTVSVDYETGTEDIVLLASSDSLTPNIHTDNILSVVDIPGSTIVFTEPTKLLNDVTISAAFIHTPRGQKIEADSPQPINVSGRLNVGETRIFIFHFDLMSDSRRRR